MYNSKKANKQGELIMNEKQELGNYLEDFFKAQNLELMANCKDELKKLSDDPEYLDFFGKEFLDISKDAVEDAMIEKEMRFLKNIL